MTPDEYCTSRREAKQGRDPQGSLQYSFSSNSTGRNHNHWLTALSSRMRVLEIQDEQRAHSGFSDAAIRHAYEAASTPSRRRAEQLGAPDYAIVRAVHRATKRRLHRTTTVVATPIDASTTTATTTTTTTSRPHRRASM